MKIMHEGVEFTVEYTWELACDDLPAYVDEYSIYVEQDGKYIDVTDLLVEKVHLAIVTDITLFEEAR